LLVPDSYELEELHLTLLSIIARDDAAVLLAEVDGAPVGLAEIYMCEELSASVRVGRRYAYVQNLLVTEKQRGVGAGTALMAAVEAWARSMDAAEVQLDVWEFDAGPLPFYQRLGYGTLRRKMVKSL
jgi:GNAT superfamily N-acetyltransferase